MTRPLSPELLASLQYWGPRWHQDITAGRDAMLEAWAPLLSVSAIEPTLRGVPYGEHPRPVVRGFVPGGAGKPADPGLRARWGVRARRQGTDAAGLCERSGGVLQARLSGLQCRIPS